MRTTRFVSAFVAIIVIALLVSVPAIKADDDDQPAAAKATIYIVSGFIHANELEGADPKDGHFQRFLIPRTNSTVMCAMGGEGMKAWPMGSNLMMVYVPAGSSPTFGFQKYDPATGKLAAKVNVWFAGKATNTVVLPLPGTPGYSPLGLFFKSEVAYNASLTDAAIKARAEVLKKVKAKIKTQAGKLKVEVPASLLVEDKGK